MSSFPKSPNPPQEMGLNTRHVAIRKNSRLHHILPADVLAIKGEVLRSAISHYDIENLRNLNRKKKTLLETSTRKSASIQQVKWKPEFVNLYMKGVGVVQKEDERPKLQEEDIQENPILLRKDRPGSKTVQFSESELAKTDYYYHQFTNDQNYQTKKLMSVRISYQEN